MNASAHMFCDQCGAANPPHARFCTVCGQPLRQRTVEQKSALDAPITFASLPALPVVPQESPARTQNKLLKGRYRILTQVGSGGYGDVYKAADGEFGDRLVAIKEMSQKGLNPHETAEATEAFKREAFLLAGLTHPNLPSIYDYFTEHGRWYLVMSFIEGETLETYLGRAKGGYLPVEKVLQIGIQLAAVLSYLHTRRPPIIFRDLKPSNIMRTPDGGIYLIDFGIARHFKQGQTKDTIALGSPGYAAPEQYGRAQSTPQTDVYSLGATLHQLLTGSDPSHSPFSYVPLELPQYPQLSILVMCMLDMDTKKRPASMGNIRRELQRIATGRTHGQAERHFARRSTPGLPAQLVVGPKGASARVAWRAQPVLALPLVPPGMAVNHKQGQQQAQLAQSRQANILPWQQLTSSRRTMLSGIGLLFSGGAAAALFLQFIAKPSSSNARALPVPVHVYNTPEAASAPLPPAPLRSVAWSPDNTRLALANNTSLVRIVAAIDQQQVTGYSSSSGAAIPVASWSPDGKSLACACADGTVLLWNMGTGSVQSYRTHISPVRSLAWSRDGKYIASVDAGNRICIWDPVTFHTMNYFTPPVIAINALTWSPDNRYIATGGVPPTVQLYDAFAGTLLRSFTAHMASIEAVAWSPDGKYVASAGGDTTVRVWDATAGKTINIYAAHSSVVYAVSWSADGRRIASGSADQTVQVWPALGKGSAYTYDGHKSDVLSVAWSSDGRRIASGDAAGNLQIWTPQ